MNARILASIRNGLWSIPVIIRPEDKGAVYVRNMRICIQTEYSCG